MKKKNIKQYTPFVVGVLYGWLLYQIIVGYGVPTDGVNIGAAIMLWVIITMGSSIIIQQGINLFCNTIDN